MKTLVESLNDALINESLNVTYTEKDFNNPRTYLYAHDCKHCDEIIIDGVNLPEWTFEIDTQRTVKKITFNNCSGRVYLKIKNMKNLEFIDFGDCKDKLTILGTSWFLSCPKLSMKSKDWIEHYDVGVYNNKWINCYKCGDIEFPKEYSNNIAWTSRS